MQAQTAAAHSQQAAALPPDHDPRTFFDTRAVRVAMGKKSRRTKTSAPVDTQVDPERAEDTMDDDEDDADVPGLPLGEGSSNYDQIAAVLTGSDDAEIALVLGQAPISFALKLALGMQKLSASADAFGLLAEFAEEADTLGFIFRKVAGLTSAQVDADIRGVIDPVSAEAILTQPEWNRRRLLFLNLAAPFLEEDEEGMEQEEVLTLRAALATLTTPNLVPHVPYHHA